MEQEHIGDNGGKRMVHNVAPERLINEGPSFCARFSRIPVVLIFLVAIIAQTSVQLGSVRRLTQHQTPEIPTMPIRTNHTKTNNDVQTSKEKGGENETKVSTISSSSLIGSVNQSRAPSIEANGTTEHGGSFTEDISEDSDDGIDDNVKSDGSGDGGVGQKVTTGKWSARERNRKRRKKRKRKNKATLGHNKRKTRMIYGIMTYDSESERQRRGLIRKTFLSYFQNLDILMNVTEEEYSKKKDWICSLNDLDHGRLEHPDNCRMAYTFVQGANPNGTNMLLTFNETYPLSLPPPKAGTEEEEKDLSDMIFLNIKENGKFGKTPTWFRYAIDVLERHGWIEDWDYIFKSDTDNLLYTPNFFRYVDRKLPRRKAQLVYGGLPLDYKKCGGDKHDDCKDMKGPYFMQGGCYFLSTELTRFIVNETAFDHQAVKLPHEDMTTGNFVYSHPGKIKVMGIPRKGETIRNHPLKKEKQFQFRWAKMLREERARQNTNSPVLDGSLDHPNILQLPARRENSN